MDANEFKKEFKQAFVYVLKATTKVGDFKYEDVNKFFREAYEGNETDLYYMWLSMINSAFTHMSKTFIISRATMYYLCYHDPNVKSKIKVHANNYSTFLSLCFEKGYIKRLREPTGRRGGVYQIIHPKVVQKMNEIQGMMFFEDQEKYVLNVYDSSIEDGDNLNEDSLVGTKEERKKKLLDKITKAEEELG